MKALLIMFGVAGKITDMSLMKNLDVVILPREYTEDQKLKTILRLSVGYDVVGWCSSSGQIDDDILMRLLDIFEEEEVGITFCERKVTQDGTTRHIKVSPKLRNTVVVVNNATLVAPLMFTRSVLCRQYMKLGTVKSERDFIIRVLNDSSFNVIKCITSLGYTEEQ